MPSDLPLALRDAEQAIQEAPPMMTLAQVYRRFHVDRRTVYKWVEHGILKAYKLPGAGYRFDPEDVEAFRREHLIRSA